MSSPIIIEPPPPDPPEGGRVVPRKFVVKSITIEPEDGANPTPQESGHAVTAALKWAQRFGSEE